MNQTGNEQSVTLYVKADEHSLVYQNKVRLCDVFEFSCSDENMKKKLKNLLIYTYPEEVKEKKYKHKAVVCSVMDVISQIQEYDKNVQVVNLGAEDFIIEYVSEKNQAKWLEYLKLIMVCLITFFGAAFTIMAFNNDISISGVFERFYMQVIGSKKPAVSEIDVMYSIGLAIGITVFFNHIGNKKITTDPTPIQVELRKYEADMNETFIENASRKARKESKGKGA